MSEPVVIGVDMSINSPGVAVWNANTRALSLYFIPQRKRECKGWKYQGTWSLHTWRRWQMGVMQHIQTKKSTKSPSTSSKPLKYISVTGKEEKITLHNAAAAPPPSYDTLLAKPVPSEVVPKDDANDAITVTIQALPPVEYDSNIHTKEHRFHYVVESLFTVIDPLAKEKPIVVIEGHAMGKDPRRFAYTIEQHEIGGLFRHRLFRVGLRYIEISPKSVKMGFTGSGDERIDKRAMIKQFLDMEILPMKPPSPSNPNDPRPYLFQLFDLTYPPPSEVQHPVQDIGDSMAIIQTLYLHSFLQSLGKPKGGKRKIQVQ